MFGIEKYRKSTTELSEEENNSSEIYRNYNANNNMNLSSDGYYDKYLKYADSKGISLDQVFYKKYLLYDLDENLNPSLDIYRDKYLKYKAKYLQLKSIEQEGGILELGDGVIFTTKQVALKLRADIKSRLIRTATDFYATLTNQAYIIVNGMKHAELVKKTKEKEQAKEEMKVKEQAKEEMKVKEKEKKLDTESKGKELKSESKEVKNIIKIEELNKDLKKTEDKKQQDGGSELPKKIPNFNKERFDSLNENHRKYLKNVVASLFKVNENEIELVDASFRRMGFPQLK